MALRARGIPDYLFTSPWICSFYYSWQPGKIPYLDLAFEQLARSMHKVVEGLDEPRDLKIINDSGEQAVSDCDIEIATQVFSAEALKAREEEALNRYFTGDPNQIKPCDLDQNCSERTKAWIPKIERLHRDKGVFAFVGVAHLVGDGGLVKLLRDRHHRVIQVKNAEQLKAILDREVRR